MAAAEDAWTSIKKLHDGRSKSESLHLSSFMDITSFGSIKRLESCICISMISIREVVLGSFHFLLHARKRFVSQMGNRATLVTIITRN